MGVSSRSCGLAGNDAWLQGRAPSYGDGITYWALAEMVRRRAGLAENADAEVARAAIEAMVAPIATDQDEAASITAALLSLLAIGQPEDGATRLEKGELFTAWRTLFERVADAAPTVLVVEDLHWADDGLVEFIAHLVEWSRRSPILLVTLARPEVHERWPDFAAEHSEHQRPPSGAARHADDAHARGRTCPVSRTRWSAAIARRADGIPLYAVEMARMLVADGTVEATADPGIGSRGPSPRCDPTLTPSSVRVSTPSQQAIGSCSSTGRCWA